MSTLHLTADRADRRNEIIAGRSQADFVIRRPLFGPRRGSIGGLRGWLLRTPEHIRVRVCADTRMITLEDGRPLRPFDPDRYPEVELEVEATRFTWDQRLLAGRARLSLGARSLDVDAMIHDVGGAPAGGGWPERQFVAVSATVPRGLLIEGMPDSIRRPRWDQLGRLDLRFYLESTVPESGN